MICARRSLAVVTAVLVAVGTLTATPVAAQALEGPVPMASPAAADVASAARAEVAGRWDARNLSVPPVAIDFGDTVAESERAYVRAGTIGAAQYWELTKPMTMSVGDHAYAGAAYDRLFSVTNGYEVMTGNRGVAGANGAVMNIEGLRVDWNRLQTAPHEVTHVVQFSHVGGEQGREPMDPCWVTEGMASFYGYNLGSLATDLDYVMSRGRVIDELHMWGPLENYEVCDNTSTAQYIVGFLASEYLIGTYGQDAYIDFLDRRATEASWQSAFGAAFGLLPGDFYDRFEVYRAATVADRAGGPPTMPGLRDTASFACPPPEVPDSGFVDIAGNTFEDQIHCIAFHGITTGGPSGRPANEYGPSTPVTRGQMATFLVRMLTKIGPQVLAPYDGKNRFGDVSATNPHLESISRLAAAGLANGGVGGRSANTFSPGLPVARAQMASFIARALGAWFGWDMCHPSSAKTDYFGDDNGNSHEGCINGLVQAGIVGGVGPGRYAPKTNVNRGQMSAFVMRAVDLATEVIMQQE